MVEVNLKSFKWKSPIICIFFHTIIPSGILTEPWKFPPFVNEFPIGKGEFPASYVRLPECNGQMDFQLSPFCVSFWVFRALASIIWLNCALASFGRKKTFCFGEGMRPTEDLACHAPRK